MDVRLTKPFTRKRRSELKEDNRISFRGSSSDWLEVGLRERNDIQVPGPGLGQALLLQAVTSAQARRWRLLGRSAAMTAAQRPYKSAGFVTTGTRP
jgi:hypothetical protein